MTFFQFLLILVSAGATTLLAIVFLFGKSLFSPASDEADPKPETVDDDLVTTLSETFAHLSIGLLIFDKSAQLSLFNPAAAELTGLTPEFLLTKPKAESFFDKLRENRHMPEPKNYPDWRQKMTQIIMEAAEGAYQETWPLENGRTYSVIGKPLPLGAMVFLIEDISAELAINRNFRSEMALAHLILDRLDEGLIVFSTSGNLIFSNLFYSRLWKQDLDSAVADLTLSDAVTFWASKSNNPDVFSDLINVTKPKPQMLTIQMTDGTELCCGVETLLDQATLIRFQRQTIKATGEISTVSV